MIAVGCFNRWLFFYQMSTRSSIINHQSSPPVQPPKVLTIAGSDSGGAAGLQADLRTFAALKVYGMSVVTAVTAQNSIAVTSVHPLPPDFVAQQLDAVLSDYGATAVKTGFLGRTAVIETVAAKLHEYAPGFLVIDPVLVNHQGKAMFPEEVTAVYATRLFPLADLVTPNRAEAALLAGMAVNTLAEMEKAARRISALGPQNVLMKGGRDEGDMVDVFYDGDNIIHMRSPYIDTQNTHGSGDTLSAAVCALLARGMGMETAVRQAHQFTVHAIQKAAGWQLGAGHGPVAQW